MALFLIGMIPVLGSSYSEDGACGRSMVLPAVLHASISSKILFVGNDGALVGSEATSSSAFFYFGNEWQAGCSVEEG